MPQLNSHQTKNKFNFLEVCQPLKDDYEDKLEYSGMDQGLDTFSSSFLGAIANYYQNFLYINEDSEIKEIITSIISTDK